MIRPLGKWTPRHLFWLPLALCLAPIVRANYRARMRGDAPDRWHWADAWLLEHGFVVKIDG